MKTFLATLLVYSSLLASCAYSPAFAQAEGCYDIKQVLKDAAEGDAGWNVEQTLKDVNEDGDMYSSVVIFSSPGSPGFLLVAWFQDECLADYNVVTSAFVQEYITKFVH